MSLHVAILLGASRSNRHAIRRQVFAINAKIPYFFGATGTPAGIAVIIGTISGITGGIIRDVLTGQPPAVFTGQVYALAAIAGTTLYALLIRASVNASFASWISVAGVFVLRAYALHRDWTITTIAPRTGSDPRNPRQAGT